MFSQINDFIVAFDNLVWGRPLILIILATGIFLSARLAFVQIKNLPLALKYVFHSEKDGSGEVSSFGALCTALSATIGTGNIVGVATALVAGGPGALFWMWIAAFFGMATKFSEGLLAVKYRSIDSDGHALGGPFYYIEKGLGKQWKWLAVFFSIFGIGAGLMGIGTITQINGITSAVNNFFDPQNLNTISLFGRDYSISVVIAGLVITICAALVIIGGLQRISKVAQVIVPFMAVIYVAFCVLVIITNYSAVPDAIVTIITGAFNPKAVTGGAVGSIIIAMQKGIARGIFSNEAGLGSAPIAAAAARTNEPTRQALVTMTGTFIDTIIICTLTGITIVIGEAWNKGLEGVAVTTKAFQDGLSFISPSVISFVLMMCLVFFAFTTILGWDYYSERCLEYLTRGNKKAVKIYKYIYILAVFIGPYMTVAAVWNLADIMNGLMAFPNLVALIALNGVIVKETKNYFERRNKGIIKD
ncbi:MAG: alanine:cation symporter family protein [Clostridia bacterium]|jgi:AGCS family alanine or glycine:cation symporter|nr:alanine:cation symporter family protein [Clostridia bacterium]MCI2014761.1 alanine:cation symporter family protein [Clostridia bacterium]